MRQRGFIFLIYKSQNSIFVRIWVTPESAIINYFLSITVYCMLKCKCVVDVHVRRILNKKSERLIPLTVFPFYKHSNLKVNIILTLYSLLCNSCMREREHSNSIHWTDTFIQGDSIQTENTLCLILCWGLNEKKEVSNTMHRRNARHSIIWWLNQESTSSPKIMSHLFFFSFSYIN